MSQKHNIIECENITSIIPMNIILSGGDIRQYGGGEKEVLNIYTTFGPKTLILSPNLKKGHRIADETLSTNVRYYKSIPVFGGKSILPIGLLSHKMLIKLKSADTIASFQVNAVTIIILVLLSRISRVKVLLFLHDPIFFNPGKGLLERVYKYIQMQFVIRIRNVHVELRFEEVYLRSFSYKGSVFQFPMYFPFRDYRPEAVPQSKFKILFVGRLNVYQKGLDILSQVIKDVLKRVGDIEFHIVGSGEDGEPLMIQLQDEFPYNVIWRRFVSENDLVEELKSSSLFVFPSRFETLGLSMLEALSFGTCIIAFDLPTVREISEVGEVVSVKCFDTKAFVNAVISQYMKWKVDAILYQNKRLEKAEIFKTKFNEMKLRTQITNMIENLS